MAPRGKQPPLKFPLLILLLITFSLVLLVGYAAQLSSAAAGGVSVMEMRTLMPKSVTQLPSPPVTVSENLVTSTSTSKSTSRYSMLFNRDIVKDVSGITPTPLAYDPNPTQDPRGSPLSRSSQEVGVIVNNDFRFINTTDRRTKRVPPVIPSILENRFPNEADYNKKWGVVIGIPSIDIEKGARRRQYQRDSWFKYSSVWNHQKSSESTILVKYLLAYHPQNNYTVSDSLYSEAAVYKDVIFFDMKEGVWSSQKKSWAVEVGMSRKAFAWYQYAADYLKTDYVMKGDDDEFIRCNMLISELMSLNFDRVYYGRIMQWGIKKGSKKSFPFSGGMSITLSYDLIDWIRDSSIAETNVDYYHEDVMVGRWFYSSSIPLNVVKDCRHHDVHRGANKQQQTSQSLCIHHLKDSSEEYLNNFKMYPDTSLPSLKPKKEPEIKDWLGNTITTLGSCKK